MCSTSCRQLAASCRVSVQRAGSTCVGRTAGVPHMRPGGLRKRSGAATAVATKRRLLVTGAPCLEGGGGEGGGEGSGGKGPEPGGDDGPLFRRKGCTSHALVALHTRSTSGPRVARRYLDGQTQRRRGVVLAERDLAWLLHGHGLSVAWHVRAWHLRAWHLRAWHLRGCAFDDGGLPATHQDHAAARRGTHGAVGLEQLGDAAVAAEDQRGVAAHRRHLAPHQARQQQGQRACVQVQIKPSVGWHSPLAGPGSGQATQANRAWEGLEVGGRGPCL